MKPLRQRIFMIFGMPVLTAIPFIIQAIILYFIAFTIAKNLGADDTQCLISGYGLGALIGSLSMIVVWFGIFNLLGILFFDDNYYILEKINNIYRSVYYEEWHGKIKNNKITYFDKRYAEEDKEWKKTYDEVYKNL